MCTNLARNNIKALKAYGVRGTRTAEDITNLDFNERVTPDEYGLLCSYPEYSELLNVLAEYTGLKYNCILPCNGSDQAIDMLMRTFADSDSQVIIPQPAFSMYEQWAAVNKLQVVKLAYSSSHCFYPADEVIGAITERTSMVFICNPNNPTGVLTDLTIIERIARAAPHVLIYVDEAYVEYSCLSALPLLSKYPNIAITRTFSKAFGLAGYRIGYIMASHEHINELRKVRAPFDVNSVAARAAINALADTGSMRDYCADVMLIAKPLLEQQLRELVIEFFPSKANFLLIKCDRAQELAELLLRAGWRIKAMHLPDIGHCARITIGPANKMRHFATALKKAMKHMR